MNVFDLFWKIANCLDMQVAVNSAVFDDTIRSITQLIFRNDAPVSVDLALVLGSPTPSSLMPAIELYHAGMTKRILISGKGRAENAEPEWQVYFDYARSNGVAPEDILIEKQATNTLENICFSAELIERHIGWESVARIALCCKPLHSRRAFLTGRRHLPSEVELVVLHPRDPSDIQPENWWQNETGITLVLGEMRKIAEYAQKGDLSIIPPRSRSVR